MIQKRSNIDWPTVLKTLAGGATLGAGLGTGTSLIRYLSTLNQKAQKSKPVEDIVYLNLPPRGSTKMASGAANNAATFAAAGLAGVGGTYAAYNLVRDTYTKLRKHQLEKEIQGAQQTYIDALASQTKMASGQFSGITKMVGTGYLMALLSALGSGVVTNKILQKQFPAQQSAFAGRKGPKRIVIRTMPESDDTVSPDATENLLRQNLANKKVAKASGLGDLVSAVAQGRGPELKSLLSDYTGSTEAINMMFDSVKGASLTKTSSVNRNLAVTWLVTDPLLSQALTPVIAAEYYDWVPHCKIAAHIDPEWHQDLMRLTESVMQETRQSIFAPLLKKLASREQIKSATSILSNPIASKFIVADAVNRMLLNHQPQDQDSAVPTTATTSEDSSGGGQAQSPDFEVDDADAQDFLNHNKDTLDQVFA